MSDIDDTVTHPQVMDILSEDFAEFALDEIEEAPRLADRTAVTLSVLGQMINAQVLGFSSSYREGPGTTHTGHMPGTPPNPQIGCSACRWADVAILSVWPVNGQRPAATPSYLVALMGKSEVPGEEHRLRTVWTTDPLEVLKGLFVGNRGNRGHGPATRSRFAPSDAVGSANTKLPYTNAMAFREAAKVDPGVQRVCEVHDSAIPSPEPTIVPIWEL